MKSGYDRKIFQVSRDTGVVFYVVAKNHSEAAILAEEFLDEKGYGAFKSIEQLADVPVVSN